MSGEGNAVTAPRLKDTVWRIKWRLVVRWHMACQVFTFTYSAYFVYQKDANKSCYRPRVVLIKCLCAAGSCGRMTPTLLAMFTAASSSRWSRKLDASSARDTATHRTGWEIIITVRNLFCVLPLRLNMELKTSCQLSSCLHSTKKSELPKWERNDHNLW